MGARGPKAKHESIKLANGTFRRDRDASLPAPTGDPEPPELLRDSAREVWFRLVDLLNRTPGLLSPVDASAMARYCNSLIEYMQMQKLVDEQGYIAFGKSGPYQHPAVGIRNKADDRMTKFEARFGMTPSDRVGLGVNLPKAQGVRRRQSG